MIGANLAQQRLYVYWTRGQNPNEEINPNEISAHEDENRRRALEEAVNREGERVDPDAMRAINECQTAAEGKLMPEETPRQAGRPSGPCRGSSPRLPVSPAPAVIARHHSPITGFAASAVSGTPTEGSRSRLAHAHDPPRRGARRAHGRRSSPGPRFGLPGIQAQGDDGFEPMMPRKENTDEEIASLFPRNVAARHLADSSGPARRLRLRCASGSRHIRDHG